jgi:hypothetical protein
MFCILFQIEMVEFFAIGTSGGTFCNYALHDNVAANVKALHLMCRDWYR